MWPENFSDLKFVIRKVFWTQKFWEKCSYKFCISKLDPKTEMHLRMEFDSWRWQFYWGFTNSALNTFGDTLILWDCCAR